MLQCLPEEEQAPLRERLATLAPAVDEDRAISGDLIAEMTSADRKAGDSLHLVVMDAHRAINAFQAATAVEMVAARTSITCRIRAGGASKRSWKASIAPRP